MEYPRWIFVRRPKVSAHFELANLWTRVSIQQEGQMKLGRLVFIAVITIAGLATAVQAAEAEVEVVAGGLNNPRGISIGLDGAIYVTESGKGGSGACLQGPEGGASCFGLSGSITRIDLRKGTQTR